MKKSVRKDISFSSFDFIKSAGLSLPLIVTLKTVCPLKRIFLFGAEVAKPLLSLFPDCDKLILEVKNVLEDNDSYSSLIEKLKED